MKSELSFIFTLKEMMSRLGVMSKKRNTQVEKGEEEFLVQPGEPRLK